MHEFYKLSFRINKKKVSHWQVWLFDFFIYFTFYMLHIDFATPYPPYFLVFHKLLPLAEQFLSPVARQKHSLLVCLSICECSEHDNLKNV